MAKSRDAFRTISEVSAALDTPTHVLRFWESKFSQIKPVKRAGGRRYYRPDDIALLSGIKTLLHDQGMTIKGAQKLLREQGVKHVMSVGDMDRPEATPTPQPVDAKTEIESAAVENVVPITAPAAAPAAASTAAPRSAILPDLANRAAGSLAAKSDQIRPLIDQLAAVRDRIRSAS